MTISVVIPVFIEEKRIIAALSAIQNGSLLPMEIIVVDGGSSDRTVSLVQRSYPDVILLNNPDRTAAAGRNVGIQKARGDIVAFTDGDCIVDKDWLRNILKHFEQQDIDGLGGKVLNAVPENHYEEYWGNLAWNLIMSFPDKSYVVKEKKLNDAFVTANCAYKRSLLDRIHGFNEFFANNAEDVDLCWRAVDSGAKLIYVPDVVIYAHNVTTLKGIAKKSFRNGVSSSKLQKVYGGKVNFDPNIYKMLRKNLAGIVKKEKDAKLNCVELLCHLFGKYYGSVKVGVINI